MERAARGVLEVARSVLDELDLETVLQKVLEAAQQLTGARYAALGVLNEARTGLDRFVTRGIDEARHAEIGELPRGRGVLGELIERPRPLRLPHVGQHPHSWGFPPGHPPMDSFVGVPILVRGTPYGNLYLTEKADGAEFTADDEEALVLLAEFAGVAIDHAGRYTGARDRERDLERTVAALDATTQIAQAVGGETDLDVILELVAKRGRALVQARTLLIELVDGDDLRIASAAGEFPPDLVGDRVPLPESVAAAALRTRRTQHLEDELNRSRFEQHGVGRLGVQAESGLIVPLVFRNQSYGVLVALDRLREGPAFSNEDQRLLEAFATSAATAVATATSVAVEHHRQRLAAAEDERRRWARELHDDTLQSLAAVQLMLGGALRSENGEALRAAVNDAIAQLRSDTANLRALITDLRPAALDEFGVHGALETLVERVARNGIEVDLHVDLAFEHGRAGERLTSELEAAVYRIVQEALTNAGKHGGARTATVSVVEDDRAVHVSVRDDGQGFDPGAKTSGFGLLGMRERVELLGGTLAVESAPGEGTTVLAELPSARLGAQQMRRAAGG